MSKIKDDEPSNLKGNNTYLFMDDFTPETVAPVIEFILEKISDVMMAKLSRRQTDVMD